MPNISIVVAITTVAIIGSTACATKGFVRTDVGKVSEKVESLSTSLEQTQQHVQTNEAQIREVDQEAEAALQAAKQAAERSSSRRRRVREFSGRAAATVGSSVSRGTTVAAVTAAR